MKSKYKMGATIQVTIEFLCFVLSHTVQCCAARRGALLTWGELLVGILHPVHQERVKRLKFTEKWPPYLSSGNDGEHRAWRDSVKPDKTWSGLTRFPQASSDMASLLWCTLIYCLLSSTASPSFPSFHLSQQWAKDEQVFISVYVSNSMYGNACKYGTLSPFTFHDYFLSDLSISMSMTDLRWSYVKPNALPTSLIPISHRTTYICSECACISIGCRPCISIWVVQARAFQTNYPNP